jgi:hypothetical protein
MHAIAKVLVLKASCDRKGLSCVSDRKSPSFKSKLRSLFLNCVCDRLNLNFKTVRCDRTFITRSRPDLSHLDSPVFGLILPALPPKTLLVSPLVSISHESFLISFLDYFITCLSVDQLYKLSDKINNIKQTQ